jgi:hypothetical protein
MLEPFENYVDGISADNRMTAEFEFYELSVNKTCNVEHKRYCGNAWMVRSCKMD